MKGRRPRLGAGDWVEAALAALGEGGLAAVAVEPLAARLGTTKGSFYWHFTNRDALIEATLAHWEELNTGGVIAAVDAEPDPRRRLRKLFTTVPAAVGGDPVEIALLANARHPLVAAALGRVTARRVDYVTGILVDLGFSADEARRRGLLVYASHLGQIHLIHAAPQVLPPDREERRRYLDTLMYTLLRPE